MQSIKSMWRTICRSEDIMDEVDIMDIVDSKSRTSPKTTQSHGTFPSPTTGKPITYP